jgi:transcription initiation factor IIE alpha subunit
MKEIGRYDENIMANDLCITKQSINKWLKVLYEKPNRIFDFLEVP